MRVLWFVNTSFPAMRKQMGISDYGQHGWWMTSLASALIAETDILLGVVWADSQVERFEKIMKNGVTYYCVPSGSWRETIARRLGFFPILRKAWRLVSTLYDTSTSKELALCIGVTDDFQPDIIHVHGTEHFYGLISTHVKQPVIVSLQGILTAYVKEYWGKLSFLRRLLLPQENWQYRQMRRGARRERKIFIDNTFFQGRTHWDRNLSERLSPRGLYFANGEVIRNVFYKTEWSLEDMGRHRIYCTTTPHPYKGTNILIEAFAIVRERNPDSRLIMAGPIPLSGLGRYLRKTVKKLGLENCVEFRGYVSGKEIAEELGRAHVFALPSFIENSPNSLAEAQLVGTPCVASDVGGVPSMVEDNQTGLLFPKGDIQALASSIERIFADDTLAVNLSRNSRKVAAKRHNSKLIVKKQISTYREVIRINKEDR